METNHNGFGPYPVDSMIYLAGVFTPEECQQIINIGTEHWTKNDGSIGDEAWGENKKTDYSIRTTTIYAANPETLVTQELTSDAGFAGHTPMKFTKSDTPSDPDAFIGHDGTAPRFQPAGHQYNMKPVMPTGLRGFQDWLYKKIMDEVNVANNGNEYFPGWQFNIGGILEIPQLMVYESSRSGHYEWHIDIGPFEPACRRKIAYTLILNSKDEYDGGDLLFKLDKDEYYREFYEVGGMVLFPTYLFLKVTPITIGSRYVLCGWIHGDKPWQ